MIYSPQPVKAPRLRLLKRGRRAWIQRFWDTEELFELKLTLLVLLTLVGALMGA